MLLSVDVLLLKVVTVRPTSGRERQETTQVARNILPQERE